MVGDLDMVKEILVKEFTKFHDRKVIILLSGLNYFAFQVVLSFFNKTLYNDVNATRAVIGGCPWSMKKSTGPAVQTLDSAIPGWINHYPAKKYLGNQLHYPLDRDLSIG